MKRDIILKKLLCKIAALFAAATLLILVGCSANVVGSDTDSVSYKSENVCTFSIDCSAALASSYSHIPSDGVILSEREFAFEDGESVADVLRRVCTENSIQLETSAAPLYGSIYVEGIANLYEFDCGQGSGWMYCVNGEFPNVGASSYILSPGDRVEWKYTCDFGEDIGGNYHPD